MSKSNQVSIPANYEDAKPFLDNAGISYQQWLDEDRWLADYYLIEEEEGKVIEIWNEIPQADPVLIWRRDEEENSKTHAQAQGSS